MLVIVSKEDLSRLEEKENIATSKIKIHTIGYDRLIEKVRQYGF